MEKYRICINELVESLLEWQKENIKSILLYGGIVRDGSAIAGWSDIDMVIIFKTIEKRNSRELAALVDRLQEKYTIRLDINQVSLEEINNPALLGNFYNSEIINAILLRENVAEILYGKPPVFTFSLEQEQQAALYYLNNMLFTIRKYYIEFVYKEGGKNYEVALPKLTRWIFSVVRSSLRLFGIFVHPYEYAIDPLKNLFPALDISILYQLIKVRKENLLICEEDTFERIEKFVEMYYQLVIIKYHEISK